AKLILKGRFDFNSQRLFRSSYDTPLGSSEVKQLEIDLGDVEYLDSSALGMLLLLKERASVAGKDIVLANCRGTVKQVLEIANFNKLFTTH
ncbi:MAG: STAS domain-containing protein, partial [Sulfuricellaceae bacterium]|nr:STAS domain-containing protein [Sulfuricellaceae bacterium]